MQIVPARSVLVILSLARKCADSLTFHQTLRWEVISALDILFEVAVPIAAAMLVWPLKAATTTKLNVVFAFSFRLLWVPVSYCRSRSSS